MQCIWPTLARSAVRTCKSSLPPNARSSYPQAGLYVNYLTGRRVVLPYTSTQKSCFARTLSTEALRSSSAAPPSPIVPISTSNTPDPCELSQTVVVRSQSPLTTPQMSRAAASAVRLSMNSGDIDDAYLVVNSIRYARMRDSPTMGNLQGIGNHISCFKAAAIRFSPDVSPRLSSHALIHGLIRCGLTHKASTMAKHLMKDGFKIRTKTLEAVMLGLAGSAKHDAIVHRPPSNLLQPCEASQIKILSAKDPNLRLALSIMMAAGKTRQNRTKSMFSTLITLCIINGEIILGSLIFGLLLKTWQSRDRELKTCDDIAGSVLKAEVVRTHSHLHATRVIIPSASLIQPILLSIKKAISADGEGEAFTDSLRCALQALANLAQYLDQRLIPFGDISLLVSLLYKCPRVDHEVWIFDESGKSKRVDAYSYFHAVLKRLMSNLPTKHPNVLASNNAVGNRALLPPLDIDSYNALLHYALRHRLSPALANRLLHHMTEERCGPLKPNLVTTNILLRSGTLLRRSDIAGKALQLLQLDESGGKGKGVISTLKTNRSYSQRFSKALHRANHDSFNPSGLHPSRKINPDVYSLSSYIAHLRATGNVEQISKIVRELLPGLHDPDFPNTNGMESEQQRECIDKYISVALKRATQLGPYVFTTMLDALSKAGKTGLTEWVWIWAKKAEIFSWQGEDVTGVKPWCLPVHAYTTMINCYANEARRGALHTLENRSDAHSATSVRGRYALGWGRFCSESKDLYQRRLERGTMGRKLGVLLYKNMQDAAQNIYESLKQMTGSDREKVYAQMQVPQPDAYFFKAILRIVSKRPRLRPRKPKSKARCRYQLLLAKKYHIRCGYTSEIDPILLEVLQDMVQAGIPIPPALRPLAVGHLSPQALNFQSSSELDRAPFAFPRSKEKSCGYYPITRRTKGLPLRHSRSVASH